MRVLRQVDPKGYLRQQVGPTSCPKVLPQVCVPGQWQVCPRGRRWVQQGVDPRGWWQQQAVARHFSALTRVGPGCRKLVQT